MAGYFVSVQLQSGFFPSLYIRFRHPAFSAAAPFVSFYLVQGIWLNSLCLTIYRDRISVTRLSGPFYSAPPCIMFLLFIFILSEKNGRVYGICQSRRPDIWYPNLIHPIRLPNPVMFVSFVPFYIIEEKNSRVFGNCQNKETGFPDF